MSLSANNKTDFYLIKNNLESTIWYAKEFDSGSWNPAEYNIGGSFSEILNTNQYAIEERLRNISIKLKNAGAYYEAAKNNINNPTNNIIKMNNVFCSIYFYFYYYFYFIFYFLLFTFYFLFFTFYFLLFTFYFLLFII